MANILNKSTHPVQVKKVSLKTWKLRDEIEHLISLRVTPDQSTPDIEDIKNYFDPNNKEQNLEFNREAPASTVSGEMILSDISMSGVLIFSEEKYTPGQNIGLKFNIPKSFILTAQIDNCLYQGRKSKVIGINKYHYRLQCVFEFKYESEKDALRDFLKSIEPDIPPAPLKLQNSKDQKSDSDDDFGDLGL
jgi:hypothetical protein